MFASRSYFDTWHYARNLSSQLLSRGIAPRDRGSSCDQCDCLSLKVNDSSNLSISETDRQSVGDYPSGIENVVANHAAYSLSNNRKGACQENEHKQR